MMEMKVNIPFQQLLKAVKSLTPAEKTKLKEVLNTESSSVEDKSAFIETLLNGPVYTEEDIKTIEDNKRSIAKWRTKE